jgi:hypothetical protein
MDGVHQGTPLQAGTHWYLGTQPRLTLGNLKPARSLDEGSRPPATPADNVQTVRCALQGRLETRQVVRAGFVPAPGPEIQAGRQERLSRLPRLRRRSRGIGELHAATLGAAGRRRTTPAPRLRFQLLATSLLPQLDAAVFGAALVAAVVGNRLTHAVTLRGQAVGSDSF